MSTPVIPRPEHPRPQMVRPQWRNLNGEWDFLFDFGVSGEERKFWLEENFEKQNVQKILVPFCPESRLSGIGYVDFMNAVWYKRHFELTEKELSGRVLLHFGAVDDEAKIWINGAFAGSHEGGYSSFTLDITEHVHAGDNVLIVGAVDVRKPGKPGGKQCGKYYSYACSYTRTTGIWQTVWLEFVPKDYIQKYKVYPDPARSCLRIDTFVSGPTGSKVICKASYNGQPVGELETVVNFGCATGELKLSQLHLWDVGQPELYDLEIIYGEDRVEGYFGMRSVDVRPDALYINNRPVFMRLVLDQGFNPEGIYTFPTDEYLKHDIELSMEAGFNGARLHARVFEERTLYWADKLGYIVWSESAAGNPGSEGRYLAQFLPQWLSTVDRDFNHPSIIGWAAYNETYWCKEIDPVAQTNVYNLTKMLDPTRPVIDASGGMHYKTDMFCVHDYSDGIEMKKNLEPMLTDPMAFNNPLNNDTLADQVYGGQAYWNAECGGIFWNPDLKPGEDGWGYGNSPKTEEEFAQRYERTMLAMLEHPRVCGFCYTQLTDIEQEQNGVYKYDRSRKFSDPIFDRIRAANMAPAAIEQKK